MSIRVMNHVWQYSKSKESARLVLLAIADHAHDDGCGAYPSIDTLAKKTLVSPRQVKRIIRKLKTMGELEIIENAGPHRTHLFIVRMNRMTNCQGDIQEQQGDIQGN